MKQVLSLVFLLTSISAFAQSPEKGLRLGLIVSPDYAYRSITTNDPAYELGVEIQNDYHVPRLGFTTGLGLLADLSRRLTLETGLLIADKGYRTERVSYTDINGDLLGEGRSRFHDYFLEIPLKVNLTVLDKGLKVYLAAGVSGGLHLQQRWVARINPEDKVQTTVSKNVEEVDPLSFSLIGGLGLEYQGSERISLRLEPAFRYSLTPLNADAPIRVYPWSVGCQLGGYYQL